jgi:hypothetical protein
MITPANVVSANAIVAVIVQAGTWAEDVTGEVWILNTGFWNDNGVWDDTATWID